MEGGGRGKRGEGREEGGREEREEEMEGEESRGERIVIVKISSYFHNIHKPQN